MSDLLFLGLGLIAGLLMALILVALLVWQKLSELAALHPPPRDDDHRVSWAMGRGLDGSAPARW